MTAGPRVVVADEQPAVRAMVRRTLERGGFAVCGEASEVEEAVDVALRERPDICLIGLKMAGDGIFAIRRITAELPETQVVILTGSERREDFLEAIGAGAASYLLKTMDREQLPSTLRAVLVGEAAIPGKLVAALVREFQTHGRRRAVVAKSGPVDLTRREWDVLVLMVEGLDTAKIAKRLYISPVTVRRHSSRILAKLGAEDRAEAIRLVEGQV